MPLTLEYIREKNLERCAIWHPGGVTDWSESDWAVALAGEVGEACDAIKKLNRVRDGLPGNKLTEAELRANLRKEYADILLYLDLLAARGGVNLAEVVVEKFNEVSDRNHLPVYMEQG